MLADKDVLAPITSEVIQKKHSKEYRWLFETCKTVISTPLAIALTADRTLNERRASINIQLPRRAWVGVEKNSHNGVEMGVVKEFDSISDTFLNAPTTTRERLNRLVKAMGFKDKGLYIHVLIESQGGRNMNTSGSIAAGLFSAMHIVNQDLTIEEIDSWKDMDINDQLKDPKFKQLFKDSCNGQSSIKPGRALGSGVLTALGNAQTQCIAFSNDEVRVLTPLDFGARSPLPSEWPVDIVVIATGKRNELGSEPEMSYRENGINETIDKLREHLGEDYPLTKPLRKNSFQSIKQIRDVAFMDLYQAWIELWQKSTEMAGIALMESYRRREGLFQALEVGHPVVRYIIGKMHDVLQGHMHSVFPLGTGSHGGSIIMITPVGDSRKLIPIILNEMWKIGMSDVQAEYLSWSDGWITDGLCVEQHIDSGRIGSYLIGAANKCVIVSKQSTSTVYHSRVDQFAENIDLLIDMHSNRIMIAGRSVNSREIRSQKITSDVLKLLLSSPDKNIKNSDLPHSTYRDSKGEFMTKIASPLEKTVSHRTGKELSLKAHGSVSDYTITLNLGEIIIGLIEPLDINIENKNLKPSASTVK